MPIQNVALFKAVKLPILRWIFLCFPRKTYIVAVYILSKNKKVMYTPENPSFTI